MSKIFFLFSATVLLLSFYAALIYCWVPEAPWDLVLYVSVGVLSGTLLCLIVYWLWFAKAAQAPGSLLDPEYIEILE
jgi:peptidoglycan biosynthesis protein MviN/MurJ (putative lipid II flippase)